MTDRLATKDDIADMVTKTDLEPAITKLWDRMLATQVALAFVIVAATIAILNSQP